MENNVINTNKFNEKRPRKKFRYTEDTVTKQINYETRLAVHSLRLFCIKNALWLGPLILFLVLAVIMDFIAIFFIWKNPSILFVQIEKSYMWVLVYIAGLYTDEIRRKITKH